VNVSVVMQDDNRAAIFVSLDKKNRRLKEKTWSWSCLK